MRLASIDIGTNSTRLLLAEVNNGVVTTVKTGLITTRLGQGINDGRLLPAAMERTIAAIKTFLAQSREFGATGIVAAATSAVRDAVNQAEFLQLTREATGLQVKVLSGEQEAAASYRGVLAGLPIAPQSTLVLDVGGGSTEFIWPAGNAVHYVSLPVGVVRMTEGGHSDEQIKEIISDTLLQIKKQLAGSFSLVAVGGTATSLAAMSLQLSKYEPALVHGHYLSLAEIDRLLTVLIAAGTEGRKKIIGLQPDRSDIILAGVRIIKLVLEGLELQGLTVSETDILHGLVLELAQQMSKQKLE
ncbi:Ppx/GppA phosphatase [Desulfotomaculum nigrificans CO-1-SRB]|uniref:Ppx/GppA phosphatase n=1 Tax=Desulfotomaculum nigrificans (strain DSM 14880 / VKM B-2319 / CO-1-SRB) TaxID=868595 RepID=F6B4J2_DESCC|nr:phosphatase [Desulfotomaculum nigrificans]AEF93015.1 Ppx/GppA phosphatase [Desulfotomaculum nigrificans CO-1-SRB]